jgi:hypothetical protein
MKKLALIISCISLASCNALPPNPHDVIWDKLTKAGYHVVDVQLLISSETGRQPSSLCLSAPFGGAFRAIQNGVAVIGVACLEQDNSLTIVLQK